MPAGSLSRVAFGKPLAEQGVIQEWIAESRVRIEQARLLVLKTAWLMDTVGNKGAHTEIQAIKIAVPAMTEWVIDKAIQAHGGGGVSQDFPLAALWAAARTPAPGRRAGRGAQAVAGPPRAARSTPPLRLARGTAQTAHSTARETQMSEHTVAVVTGAARGIGAAVAKRLAADGLAVAVHRPGRGRLQGDGRRDHRPPAAGRSAVGADVADAAAVQAAVDGDRRRARAARRCWSTTPACSATTCCSR